MHLPALGPASLALYDASAMYVLQRTFAFCSYTPIPLVCNSS